MVDPIICVYRRTDTGPIRQPVVVSFHSPVVDIDAVLSAREGEASLHSRTKRRFFLPRRIGRMHVAWMDVVISCRPLPFLRTCGVYRVRSHPPRLRSCPHLHVSQVPFSSLSNRRDRFTRVALRSTTKVSAVR